MRRARSWIAALIGCAVALWPCLAWAHGGESHAQIPWWLRWTWDAWVLGNLALVAALYAKGVATIWRRRALSVNNAPISRARVFGFAVQDGLGSPSYTPIARAHVVVFALSMLTLIVALVSPLDALADELSSVHMVQHMLLMLVAAPLFMLAAPEVAVLWALPVRWRKRLGRLLWGRLAGMPLAYCLAQPLLMWFVYAATMWVWHAPVLYEAALRNPLVHDLQHLMFFVSACLFWRVLVDPVTRLRIGRGLGVIYLFTTCLQCSILGVYMALARQPWYDSYVGATAAWNLTPLEDQQLAGLIMWMPACTIYSVAAAILFGVWLTEIEASGRVAVRRAT